MRILNAALLAFIFGCSVFATSSTPQSSAQTEQLEAKIMTFNILCYRVKTDELDAWKYRKTMVADMIENSGADVIGLQEAEFPQIEYLRGKLEDDFGILVTYSDGKLLKSSNALVYRKSRFDVAEWGTFWLSDMPDEPGSLGWGNERARFCTWAYFVEKKSGKGFYLYNTHLDHRSQSAREKSALLIANRIDQRRHKAPFVLTGDLNADERNSVIHFLKGEKVVLDGSSRKCPVPLVDSFRVKHGDKVEGRTFNGLDKARMFNRKIDYVFTEDAMEIVDAEIVTYDEDGHYPSDHFPVTATIRFQ